MEKDKKQLVKACGNYAAIMRIDDVLSIINEKKTEVCCYCGKIHKTFQLDEERLQSKLDLLEERKERKKIDNENEK